MAPQVLIVDDHHVVREGIGSLLTGSMGARIVGSLDDGDDAVDFLSKSNVDIVLLDVRMAGKDGLATLEMIRAGYPSVCIVILSEHDNPTYIARAAALGANDYVLKSAEIAFLVNSITKLIETGSPRDDSRMARIQQMMQEVIDPASLPKELPLTGREAQVLRHVGLGLSNKEIARSLQISVETVKEHVQNVLRKLKANDRTDAAVQAVRCGLVD